MTSRGQRWSGGGRGGNSGAFAAGVGAALLSLCWAPTGGAGVYLDAAWGFPSDDPATLFDDDEADTDFNFDLETNSAVSLAVGWDGLLLRSELEVTFRDTEGVLIRTDPPSADAGSGSFENISVMTNYFFDVPIPGTQLEVFAGGGFGLVAFDGEASGTGSLDLADFEDSGYGFAYQFKVGLLYNLTPNVGLTAGYRYWHSSEVDFGEFELDDFEVHAIDFGVRLTF
jgi:opacity protein-like surface antigen